jgi:hypothetical protein
MRRVTFGDKLFLSKRSARYLVNAAADAEREQRHVGLFVG